MIHEKQRTTIMKITSTKRLSLVIAIAMVVTLMGSRAFGAEKLLLAATRKGNWTGVGGVPLDDAQHLALSFDTTTTGVLKITVQRRMRCCRVQRMGKCPNLGR